MPTTRNAVRIQAPLDTVWKVVGDLESVTRWVPGVTTCRLDGSTRICNEGAIQEEISEYSAERRSYRFRHLRIPLPVRSSEGSFTVAADGGTVVVLEWSFEAADPAQEAELAPKLAAVDLDEPVKASSPPSRAAATSPAISVSCRVEAGLICVQ